MSWAVRSTTPKDEGQAAARPEVRARLATSSVIDTHLPLMSRFARAAQR
jgi:hypothetical protein